MGDRRRSPDDGSYEVDSVVPFGGFDPGRTGGVGRVYEARPAQMLPVFLRKQGRGDYSLPLPLKGLGRAPMGPILGTEALALAVGLGVGNLAEGQLRQEVLRPRSSSSTLRISLFFQ